MQGVGGRQPSASDMFELKWNNELAKVAQRWADQCTWHHDAERVTAPDERIIRIIYVCNNFALSSYDRARTSLRTLARTWP